MFPDLLLESAWEVLKVNVEGVGVGRTCQSVPTLDTHNVHEVGTGVVAALEFVDELADTRLPHLEVIDHSDHFFLGVDVLEEVDVPEMFQFDCAFVLEPSAQ